MFEWSRKALGVLLFGVTCVTSFAGSSGLNVVVVVNQNSADSVELGNYYCEQRGVPPQNVLRINWAGGNIVWSQVEMDNILRTPLNSMLSSRGLSNQIELVLISMDIPYRVTNSVGSVANNFNGTTSALFYGFKDNPANPFANCSLADASSSAYAGSESIYRNTPPINAASNSWLAVMLTGTNLAAAKAVVDRGVASDATFPSQSAYLAKSADLIRSSRYVLFDDAIFDTRIRGAFALLATNTGTSSGLGSPLLGFQAGVLQYNFGDTSFVPGAMADNLTSFSGFLFETTGHTGVMDFLNTGATASYGTVTEPCAYLEKFATPRNYFYQARGFNIAECYYQSLTNPYLGVLVGEPLAAPFARPAQGDWVGLPNQALLKGTTNLSVRFTSDSLTRPLQQMDLFLDGQLVRTLTNLPPQQFNLLEVSINDFNQSYSVPNNATVASVVDGLVAQLNSPTYSNSTKVIAQARGDRIELQSLNSDLPGSNVAISVSNSVGTASALSTYLTASRDSFLDSLARGYREFTVIGQVVTNDYLRLTVTRTNGATSIVAVTNGIAGASLGGFVQSLIAAVNSEPALTGGDGVIAEDLLTGLSGTNPAAQFNLRARSAGWPAAQIQAHLTGSFGIDPTTMQRLESNLADLRPRNHLYVTAGLTNWNLTFPFDTTTNADGYHELSVVAYEGSHVWTQKRVSRNIRIHNHDWAATLLSSLAGTNVAIEAVLAFTVAVNTNNVNKIELFSTGGSIGLSTNVTSANFTIPAAELGVGMHPIYAVITRSNGEQYRTETKWIRFIGAQPDFSISVTTANPTLTWPAAAGRSYQILSTTNFTSIFSLRAAVVPTNSVGVWSETNTSVKQRFYRVKSS